MYNVMNVYVLFCRMDAPGAMRKECKHGMVRRVRMLAPSNGGIGEHSCHRLQHALAQWMIQHNISHSAVDDLLKILRDYCPNLPTTASALLNATRGMQSARAS